MDQTQIRRHETPVNATLLVENIGRLVIVPPGPLVGAAMHRVHSLQEAALWIENGRIRWFGSQTDVPAAAPIARKLDAHGGCVIPGLVDCHTHIPFVGSRSDEFVRRIAGESYLSIMESGGGIRVTVEAVRHATLDDLVRENLPRLDRVLATGVTTVECKSGYGLSPEHELKQLRALAELRRRHPIEIVGTYLGAHAVPGEFDSRPNDYLDAIMADSVLATIRDERLAEFCDIFCDQGAFDVAQARRVLERAARFGLRSKLHADELAQIGASRLAGDMGAISADHLEHIDDPGIEAMRRAGAVAVILPGTSFFLGIPHADARRLIAAGLPVALATDCNPGSSMIESLPLVMNIACCQLRLLPEEALVACTANAAAAIGKQGRLGAIAEGFQADLVVLEASSPTDWMYQVGRPAVKYVIKSGRVVYPAGGTWKLSQD